MATPATITTAPPRCSTQCAASRRSPTPSGQGDTPLQIYAGVMGLAVLALVSTTVSYFHREPRQSQQSFPLSGKNC